MSRTTALTCSVVAQLVAAGGVTQRGVLPLERVAADAAAFDIVLDGKSRRGVTLTRAEPAWRTAS
jgi:saccharopine dehydrogenase-like NADP-dependent oxidoreductase